MGCSDGTVVKNLPGNAADAGELGLIPGLGRSLGEENGNPLQYSCLGNPMDRGAWPATVHGITKSWAWPWAHTQLYGNEKTHEKEPLVLNLFLKQIEQTKWKTEADNHLIISKLSEGSFIRELSQPISQHVQQKDRPSESQTILKQSKSCTWGTYKDTGKLLILWLSVFSREKGKKNWRRNHGYSDSAF